ncbi:hypothetical protein HI914_06359 [Erysiphe necator]|nr:hypothetical protein HI914_06359 [Erysiphe necator]
MEQNHQFFAELGEINGIETVIILNNQVFQHAITKHDIFNTNLLLMKEETLHEIDELHEFSIIISL